MSLSNTDTEWMRRALAIAREADATPGKNPIGCVIVLDGRIIAMTRRRMRKFSLWGVRGQRCNAMS
jgi:tRNA(adenine34) deaminase